MAFHLFPSVGFVGTRLATMFWRTITATTKSNTGVAFNF